MELLNFHGTCSQPICLALGYFDSVHIGHMTLLNKCVSSGYTPAVFTFSNNPQSCISGDAKQCYTFDERAQIFQKIGIKAVISCRFDKQFMQLSGEEFLGILCQNFNLKKVVFGTDYTCGAGAKFRAADVKEFFESRGICVEVLDLLISGGEKVASRDIRQMLKEGKIDEVNKLLPFPYFFCGRVVPGRNVGGSVVGYPTANMPYPDDKIELKAGVYKTRVHIADKQYFGLTNVGAHPTFDDYKFNLETFVIGYNGNLYDKQIKVEFLSYLRGITKFNNATELKEQIDKDLQRVIEK